MKRSRSQVLYSLLPGAMFRHESRVQARVAAVDGDVLRHLNEDVLYAEICTYLDQWQEDQRASLPLPRGRARDDFRIIGPDIARFEVFPLVLQCARRSCGRVERISDSRQLAASPNCPACSGPRHQLPYYVAHHCGRADPIYVATCREPDHERRYVRFEDTGSFVTAKWRCDGPGCSGRVIQGMSFTPCACEWSRRSSSPSTVAHRMDDQRAYRIHSIGLVNIDDTVFRQYQAHPQRGQIAAAHYLGLLDAIRDGIRQLGAAAPGTERMTQEIWDTQEAILRAQGLDDTLIQSLRELQGPADQGIAALPAGLSDLWEDLGRRQRFVERAAVFDRAHLPRITLEDQSERLTQVGELLAADTVDAAASQAKALGIEEISVTWEFPIAKAAFGYTREQHEPGQAQLMGFWRRGHIENKFPVYAATSNTEAVLVTLAPAAVLSFVQDHVGTRRDDTGDPRLILLQWMAEEPATAEIVHTLTHSLSHLLLRGLDDGQIGLAEGGLAEWLVPEALTFAIYADNVRDFTLGSLWTLLTNRALSWLEGIPARALSCENDPLCHQASPRRCERCLYLTFGCPHFNDTLDRSLVADFLRHLGALSLGGE